METSTFHEVKEGCSAPSGMLANSITANKWLTELEQWLGRETLSILLLIHQFVCLHKERLFSLSCAIRRNDFIIQNATTN